MGTMGTVAVARPGGELHLAFDLHGHLLAVAATHVARLVLGGEIAPTDPKEPVLQLDGTPWAAWNLGALLGLAPATAAWVLLHVPTVEGTTRMALATGPCFVVRPLSLLGTVPPGIFTARRGALTASFDAGQVPGAEAAVVGLVLDPQRLFTPAEIASARARTRSA